MKSISYPHEKQHVFSLTSDQSYIYVLVDEFTVKHRPRCSRDACLQGNIRGTCIRIKEDTIILVDADNRHVKSLHQPTREETVLAGSGEQHSWDVSSVSIINMSIVMLTMCPSYDPSVKF